MSQRRDLGELPDDTRPRLKILVERSAPAIDRPRLSREEEDRLNDTERKTAACYVDIEERTFKFLKLAKELNSDDDDDNGGSL